MSPERHRLEELWSRWLAGASLSAAEQAALVTALSDDEEARADLLADQRIEGALAALGRSAGDGHAFARRFAERVTAERDGRGFVSSVARQLTARARPRWRWTWLLVPAAVLLVALPLLVRARQPAAPPIVLRDDDAVREPASLPAREPLPTAVARVERARGAYLVDGARKQEAREGSWVPAGWGLMTVGAGSQAVLAFPDHTTLAMSADTSLLQVGERTRDARGKEAFLARGRVTADVPAQPAGRPLLLTTPHAEATVVGTRFTLNVDDRATRLDVEYGGVRLAGLAGGAPALVTSAHYAVVSEGSQAAVRAQERGMALLLVGNLQLQYDDERVKRRLESLGFTVLVRGSGPPNLPELERVAVVLVSSTVFSLDLNTQYRDVAVPVVVWEPSLYDDFGMTGPEEHRGCGVAAGLGDLSIKDPGHPIAAGLDGTVPVVTNGKNLNHLWMSYGIPGPGAAWIATWPGFPSRAVLFAYDRGAAMPGLAAAPARRVGFFFYDNGRLHLTEAGWKLFDAAVTWAAAR
jgi:hypothetical protein